jgi:membrane-bound lytic murein transglycosylase F
VKRDLKEIKESGELRAITIYNSTGYFLYRGRTMGFEYDLLKALAKEIGVELKVIVAGNIDELFDMLNRGEGDIVAYGLAVTEGRKQYVDFTEHHYITHQVLVQRKPNNWRRIPQFQIDKQLVTDPLDLIGDTIHVRKNSSYAERIESLSNEIGGKIHIKNVSGDLTTEEIMALVADKSIKYTVADDNIATINASYYPILDVRTAISFSQRTAWAVRKNSPHLLKEINAWMVPLKKTDFYWVTYNKYFKNKKSYRARIKSPFYSKNGGKISQYDALIKRYAEKINWDWRLLSSLIYQESQFDVDSESWAGASGLMQIMPTTASTYEIDSNLSKAESDIKMGTAYLSLMEQKWKHISDSIQRLKFTMASYNCGYAHLLDAQRLTAENGLDSLVYDDNVEVWLRKLSKREVYTHPRVRYGYVRGIEPYSYVRDIFLRYHHYQQFIPLKAIDTASAS